MLYDPKVGDIVFLCPDEKKKKFLYYKDKSAAEVNSYNRVLRLLEDGYTGTIREVFAILSKNCLLSEHFGGSDHALRVYINLNEEGKNCPSTYLPEWMLCKEASLGCMVRLTTPKHRRRM